MPKDARAQSLPLTVRLHSVAAKMVFLVLMTPTTPYAANPSAARALVPVTVRFVADATTEVSTALTVEANEAANPMHATLLDPWEMMLQFDAVMEVPTAETLDSAKPYEAIPMEDDSLPPSGTDDAVRGNNNGGRSCCLYVLAHQSESHRGETVSPSGA